MGKPKAPTPPDYAAAATAQGDANLNSAQATNYLNQANQVGPYGSLSYSYSQPGSGQGNTLSDGTYIPQTTATTTLSPGQQQLYDQNTGLSIALNNLAGKGVGLVDQATSQGPQANWTGLIGGGSTYGGGIITDPLSTAGITQGGSAFGTDVTKTGGNTSGVATGGSDRNQPLQSSYDYSGLGALPQGADFNTSRDAVVNAMLQRMNPSLQSARDAQETKLANQGISLGSEAYTKSQDQLGRNENDARIAALLAGDQTQASLFGQALASRQQGVQEANNQGNLNNSSALQGQNMDLANKQQTNAAQQQIFNQGLANSQFGNQAEAQKQAADLANIQQTNAGQQQLFNQGLANTQQHNAAIGQQQAIDLSNIQQNNAAQAQALQQGNYYQTQALNILNALRSGNQVTSPQFGNVAGGANVAAAPVYAATADAATAANNQYAQQMAGYSSMLSGLGSLGGAAIKASDRRLKENIIPTGERYGLPWYGFNYVGDTAPQHGFMADEVIDKYPEAVSFNENGFAQVDYGMIG